MSKCGYKYSELGELKIYTRIVRSSLFLLEEERVVLLFILDRTIGWHKVWNTNSSGQFVGGVKRRRKGKRVVVASGTHLTSDQVNGALMRLLEREAIEIERFGKKVAYKINEYWCHPDLQELGMWEVNESDFDYGHEQGTSGRRSRPAE